MKENIIIIREEYFEDGGYGYTVVANGAEFPVHDEAAAGDLVDALMECTDEFTDYKYLARGMAGYTALVQHEKVRFV